jgi:hypothetical protein
MFIIDAFSVFHPTAVKSSSGVASLNGPLASQRVWEVSNLGNEALCLGLLVRTTMTEMLLVGKRNTRPADLDSVQSIAYPSTNSR